MIGSQSPQAWSLRRALGLLAGAGMALFSFLALGVMWAGRLRRAVGRGVV